jgi:hypothetical protein
MIDISDALAALLRPLDPLRANLDAPLEFAALDRLRYPFPALTELFEDR